MKRKPLRWRVPEVLQASAMDCGPAALKALFEGFGIAVNYGRLREACQTTVDGTSINTLEALAVRFGLEAEQVMLPFEHLFLPGSNHFPAILVTRLPDNSTHFVLVWRRLGDYLQVMDPRIGRRWVRQKDFLAEVYLHRFPVPASGWREWAGSEDMLGPLRQRLVALGFSQSARENLLRSALDHPGWEGPAALDAAIRLTEVLSRSKAAPQRRRLPQFISQLFAVALQEAASAHPSVLPQSVWSVRPNFAEPEEGQLILCGAVLIRVRGRAGLPEAPGLSQDPSGESANPALQAAFSVPDEPVGRRLAATLFQRGIWNPLTLLVLSGLISAGLLLEALLLRGVLEAGSVLVSGTEQEILFGLLLAFTILLSILELGFLGGLRQLGRQVEGSLRIAVFRKLPRLADRYLQSRLASDMAERAHSLQVLRGFPTLLGGFVQSGTELLLTVVAIAWLYPQSGLGAAILAVTACWMPLLLRPLLLEKDLKVRTMTGAIGQSYLDSLLGLVPIQAHGGESSVRTRHEGLLALRLEAQLDFQRWGLKVLLGMDVLLSALAVSVVCFHLLRSGPDAGLLLLVYWILKLPQLGAQFTGTWLQILLQRNLAQRMLEPLGAQEEPEDGSVLLPPGAGVWIRLQNVEVQAAGQVLLRDLDLEIQPGQHVAILGASGAGKSTLLGLLLGWHRPSMGSIRVEDQVLSGGLQQQLRACTAWLAPEVRLWNRSLLENLAYGSTPEALERLGEILDKAALSPILESLPEGMQGSLGAGGCFLSGGEGQRVRLGRTLLRFQARLVLLDEPFRGLERPLREALLERCREHFRKATVLAVTHDVEASLRFDRVLLLQDGVLIEEGNPSQLLADPASRFSLLVAEHRRAYSAVWQTTDWTRLRLEAGRLTALPQEQSQG